MGRLFQPMGRRNRPQKSNKKNTNKYSNNNQNESYPKTKTRKAPKKSNAEQIFEISDEIFGGKYFCVKDL